MIKIVKMNNTGRLSDRCAVRQWLLWTAVMLFGNLLPLCAQEWTSQDSLRLQQLLRGEGELQLNPEALKEMQQEAPVGKPEMSVDKSWMDFDASMPVMPRMPEKKVVLTLRPYTANTKYNYDPVYQKKIKVDKNTWRSNPFYELTIRSIYSDWAKHPLDAGPRNSREQIEATGLRYTVTDRANNMAVGSWKATPSAPSGRDFMKYLDRNFWDFKGRKRRARTLEVLRTYGDSLTVHRREE